MRRSLWASTVGWTAGLVYLCFLALTLIKYIFTSEQQQCDQVLKGGGRWLDPPGALKPTTWAKWQPNAGCVLHRYQPGDVERCLGNKTIFFAGDSIVRNPFIELAHMFGRGDVQRQPHGLTYNIQLGSVRATFVPDDFLNKTETLDKIAEANGRAGSDSRYPGDLIMVGAGLWYRREFRPNWMEVMQQYMDPILRSKSEYLPSDRAAWIVNTVPIPKAGDPDKARASWFTNKEAATAEMNQYLQDAVGDRSRGKVVTSFSTMNLDEGAMRDTVHTIDQLAAERMSLLLNYHCNAAILGQTEFAGTCCITARPTLGRLVCRMALLIIIIWRLRRLSPVHKAWGLIEPREVSSAGLGVAGVGPVVLLLLVVTAADQTSLCGRHLRNTSAEAGLVVLVILAVVAALTSQRHQEQSADTTIGPSHDAALSSCKGWIVAILITIEQFDIQSSWHNTELVRHACLLALVFTLGYDGTRAITRKLDYTAESFPNLISQLANPITAIYLTYFIIAGPTWPALVALIALWPALASVLLSIKHLSITSTQTDRIDKLIIATLCKLTVVILLLLALSASVVEWYAPNDVPASFTKAILYIITAVPVLDAGTYYALYRRHSNIQDATESPPSFRSNFAHGSLSLLITAVFAAIIYLSPSPNTLRYGTTSAIAILATAILTSSFIFYGKTGYYSTLTSCIGRHSIEILLLCHPLLLDVDDSTILYSGTVGWLARALSLGVNANAVLGVEMVFDLATLGGCSWVLKAFRDAVLAARERSASDETGELPPP